MKKYQFSFPSADGKTTINGYRWDPDGEILGVVQLVHGMEEHILRYEEFAAFLTGIGFAAIGHDHLGHGKSVASEADRSFFAEKLGYECVLLDMHSVTVLAAKLYPGKPIFMLGHSMGSFFARRYISLYPQALQGVILSGTGFQPYLAVHVGKRLARLIGTIRGHRYQSKLIHQLAIGSYGPNFKWLCSRESVVEAYEADPACGVMFTVWAYKDFFKLMETLALGKDHQKIPAELPVLLISGMKDPVGGCTKGVLKVYNRYRKWGMKKVDVIFYKDDLHEILNENDREDVYRDVQFFLQNNR